LLKKRIYYLSGIDPRGVALYYRLFRDESRKSANLLGVEFKTSKLKRETDMVSAWDFSANIDGSTSHVNYRFLHWDDVARALWVKTSFGLICAMFPYLIAHFKAGWFTRIKQAGKAAYYNMLIPIIFSGLSVVISLLMSAAVYFMFGFFIDDVAIRLLFAGITFIALVAVALKLGEKWDIWWILQGLLFLTKWAEKPIPELEEKLDAYADLIIAEHLAEPEQELMIVGHCIGTILCIPLLSRLMQKAPASLNDKLCMVTLGQCIPYLSFMPKAQHFRADMQRVINDGRFPWVDYAARIDPFCFSQVSPAEAEGIQAGLPNRPIRRLVKPFNMFSPEKYEQLKQDKKRIHFQYLMSADIKTDYDFFDMIAQPNAKLLQPETH
jgi:hypothetical protein